MKVVTKIVIFAIVATALAGLIVLASTIRHGFSALDEPTKLEALAASTMRRWAVPADLREARNPVPLTPEVLAEGLAHFADHCAPCHGNDGKGDSALGRKMYPRTPDMTLAATQTSSDGELFATIENGVRLTGMPGFGNGTAESAHASWSLVLFIRHLPKLTSEEIAKMETLNPKSPAEWEALNKEEEFLSGGDSEQASGSESQEQGHHH